MQKKGFKWIIIGLIVVLIVGGGYAYNQYEQVSAAKPVNSTVTLFVHGYGSSVHAEHQMTQAAVKARASSSVTQAIVSPQGKVKLQGNISPHAKNPIVEVGFQNNRNSNYHQDGRWLKQVIVTLQHVYQIKKINLVGHSMGNMAIAYYLLDNSHKRQLPKLQKHVAIAGHFAGIIGVNDQPNRLQLNAAGRPNRMDDNYRTLLGLRQVYPKKVRVLNIYGDKNDGTHSDGDVSVASARSLRYLLGDRPLSYQERSIVGSGGQHSHLHENKHVDRILIKFLWN